MTKRYSAVLVTVLLCLMLNTLQFVKSYAKDKKVTPEEIVAKHLESIGSPDALSAIKSRTVYGVGYVRRPVGIVPQVLPEPSKRTEPNNFLFASEQRNLGMVLKLYDQDYPGEHFAFDGKDVTVKIIKANNKSVLGSFINSYNGILREGLLGGTLSTAWPLLDIQNGKFKLRYKKAEIDGVPFHQLTYTPKSSRYLVNIEIRIYFQFENYRHMMTEYLVMGQTAHPDLVVLEKFGNYRDVDGLKLPHSYSIEYSPWTNTRPMLWGADIKQVSHNVAVDPQLFRVE